MLLIDVKFDRRLELYFGGVPPLNDRRILQEHGFTFDGRPHKRCWYLRREPNVQTLPNGKGMQFMDGWAKVMALLKSRFGLSLVGEAALTKAREEEQHRAGVEGMLEANGII